MMRVIARNEAISNRCIFALFLLLFPVFSFAYPPYDNNVYRPEIKSVEFYNTAKQASFPVIKLGSVEKVLLAFDNLKGGSQTYNYTIEHCDASWNSSNLSPAEYLQNYNDDRIIDYSYSTGTIQKYTHYQLKLPNENIAPRIPGNYVLKVYEDNDPSKLIITRRLYVVSQQISLFAEFVPSADAATRQTNQKINFTLDYGGLRVQNPRNDIKVLVMQNARGEIAHLNTEPTYIRGTQLIYNDITINDFPGGNEFRHFDTRSLKLNSERVAHIYRDTANTVVLLTDPDRGRSNYTFQYDLNGNFYVINQEGTDPRTDADYAHIIFTLSAGNAPAAGAPYIVGKFNDYRIDDRSKLNFDAVSGKFITSQFLKQGVYDYAYVWVDAGGRNDSVALEGSHFETENDYQFLVYYHPVGARWDELAGYRLLNTLNK